jgi:hypothetical protein
MCIYMYLHMITYRDLMFSCFITGTRSCQSFMLQRKSSKLRMAATSAELEAPFEGQSFGRFI